MWLKESLNRYSIYCICFALYAFVAYGCTDQDDLSDDNSISGEMVDTRINILFDFGEEADQAKTRSDNPNAGTESESRLRSLTLFLIDFDSSGSEVPSSIKAYRYTNKLPIYRPDGTRLTNYTAILNATPGKKRLFVAANLSLTQQNDFLSKYVNDKTNAVFTGTVNDFSDTNTNNNGFAMFSNSYVDFTIVASQSTYPASAPGYPFTLYRMVSKVLVTAEGYLQTGGTYMKIGNETYGENGWIRMAEVRYLLNTTNTKVYPYPVMNNLGKRIDPNYQFNTNQLNDFSTIATDSDVATMGKVVALYDANKMPGGVGTTYTDGVYCLENIVNDPGGNNDLIRRNYTTYLRIGARYTPKHLFVVENGAVVRKTYSDELSAQIAISAQSDVVGKRNIYTPTNDSKYYYTYQAMTLSSSLGTFNKYDDGWHYYNTYVGGVKDATTGRLLFDNDGSSLLRNNYYLLNISALDLQNGPLAQCTLSVLPWNKVDTDKWFSTVSAVATAFFPTANYTKAVNPIAIPVSYNVMNTTPAGTDDYNLTFKLTVTGNPGMEWRAVLSNTFDFDFYLDTNKECVKYGTLPSIGADANGVVTASYKVAVYAKYPYDGTSRTTNLSFVVDGLRQVVNPDSPANPNAAMPGTTEFIAIKQN